MGRGLEVALEIFKSSFFFSDRHHTKLEISSEFQIALENASDVNDALQCLVLTMACGRKFLLPLSHNKSNKYSATYPHKADGKNWPHILILI